MPMNPSNDSRGHDSNMGLIQNANDSQHFVQADLAYAESNNSGTEAKPKKKKKSGLGNPFEDPEV